MQGLVKCPRIPALDWTSKILLRPCAARGGAVKSNQASIRIPTSVIARILLVLGHKNWKQNEQLPMEHIYSDIFDNFPDETCDCRGMCDYHNQLVESGFGVESFKHILEKGVLVK
ncbi:unnamed protein product [Allacma fusca]|uniref:Uncharacterized protein n=1 Tax=Allacma fusca TaxID=39272 RepID=A0A8J2K8Z0_9HEXA|nr:unnamed protein product [Allacma fusca]